VNKTLTSILFLWLIANPVWSAQTNQTHEETAIPGRSAENTTAGNVQASPGPSNKANHACKKPTSCRNGILRNGKCTCPKGARPHADRCGFTCKTVSCPPGKDWDGKKCRTKPQICAKCERKNLETLQCERQLDCIGGNIRAGLCICPKGTISETTACGHRCKTEPLPPCGKCQKRDQSTQQCHDFIECLGGNLINGECACPAGTRAGKIRCGHSCDLITCTGGRYLDGNSCSCPKGLTWNGKLCIRKKQECGSERFWNGKSCECRGDLIWNGRSCAKKITPCPEGNQWNGQHCLPNMLQKNNSS